ncbi:MAG TPA: hypothetical protein VIA09_01180 [Nitrososphaeraceae archaeon]|jgi:hypothetical protein
MEKIILLATLPLVFALGLILLPASNAQNLTNNASNAAGNGSASANQTASELGKIASEVRSDTLNETGEAAQKIGAGAAHIFGNISEEIKEGISGNNSK